MKTKMLIASVLLASSSSAVATSEVCKNIGYIALNTAEVRDNGISKNLAEVVVKGSAKKQRISRNDRPCHCRNGLCTQGYDKEQLRDVSVALCEKNGM